MTFRPSGPTHHFYHAGTNNESTHSGLSFKEHLWKGVVTLGEFVYETPSTVAILAISGLALQILFPFMGPPLFGISLSILATRLVVKVLNGYNLSMLENVKDKASALVAKYPKIQIIAFVFATALSAISHTLGFLAAGGVGIISGLLIEVNITERRQKICNPYQLDTFSKVKTNLI